MIHAQLESQEGAAPVELIDSSPAHSKRPAGLNSSRNYNSSRRHLTPSHSEPALQRRKQAPIAKEVMRSDDNFMGSHLRKISPVSKDGGVPACF